MKPCAVFLEHSVITFGIFLMFRIINKTIFQFERNLIFIGRGQWVIDNGMPYDLIEGQGHRGPKVAKMADFKLYISSTGVHIINGLMVNCDTPRQSKF